MARKPDPSRPLTRFGEFLRREEIDYSDAAKDLDCSSAWVGMLARGNGDSSPQLVLAARIEIYTRGEVPIDSWLPKDIAASLTKIRRSASAAVMAKRRWAVEKKRKRTAKKTEAATEPAPASA